MKLPETPDEWQGRVSPVHVFLRFRLSNGTTHLNFAGFLRMTRLFGASWLFENDSAF
jgi:hypothetical protein